MRSKMEYLKTIKNEKGMTILPILLFGIGAVHRTTEVQAHLGVEGSWKIAQRNGAPRRAVGLRIQGENFTAAGPKRGQPGRENRMPQRTIRVRGFFVHL